MPRKQGKRYYYGPFEFWAEGGMVTLIDRDLAGSSDAPPARAIQRLTPGDFMKRAIAVHMGTDDRYADEVFKNRKLLEEATAAAKLARNQGDPSNPKVLEHHAKHGRRRQILMPGTNDIMTPGGQLPYKINLKDPIRTLREGVDVVPDLTVMPGQGVGSVMEKYL
jgi:hypothetical protein